MSPIRKPFPTVVALVAGFGLFSGCGPEERPLIVKTSPLNGTTAVEATVIPSLELGTPSSIDAEQGHVVLYDVTAGAHKTVPAVVEVSGNTINYRPQSPLTPDHAYELTVQRGAVTGERIDEVDAAEQPPETIRWPFRLWFSTQSRPRVRAAYLTPLGGARRVTIYFSQAMDPIATAQAIQILDLANRVLPMSPPRWGVDHRVAHLDLNQPLEAAVPYTLQVGPEAVSESNVRLDGNDDGTPGGPSDTFRAAFTGSQPVILSRHPQ